MATSASCWTYTITKHIISAAKTSIRYIDVSNLYTNKMFQLIANMSVIKTSVEMLKAEEQFILDNVMYWEAFRWERFDMGYIYIHKFTEGKMYAGQTINPSKRFYHYRNLKGSNRHHTRALKKHYGTMQIAITQCPNYLLDAVEIFVIAFYDLTNPEKGYNKQTGGRKGFQVSKDSRMKISITLTGRTIPEEVRAKISVSTSGEKHHSYGKPCPEEVRAKISASQTGEKHHLYGKTRPEEVCAKMSESKKRGKHPNSKQICVFGKLYDSASTASDTLREVCATVSNDNFMTKWVHKKKHQHNIFYVSKKFYNTMKNSTEIITYDMYERWSTLE
ncbi:GIY-YIG catalytic domain-containing endonuclease [Acanthocystis turfacea Chlorella virus OR0704.3]|nr:GIY-YIG catalytic domain-containing endonuclease [Acanthocystis turfacea Chlorella virus OR0704.3]